MLPNIHNPQEGSARLKQGSSRSLQGNQVSEVESAGLTKSKLLTTRPTKEAQKVPNIKKTTEAVYIYSNANKKSVVLPHSKYILMQKELRETVKDSDGKKSNPYQSIQNKQNKNLLNGFETHTSSFGVHAPVENRAPNREKKPNHTAGNSGNQSRTNSKTQQRDRDHTKTNAPVRAGPLKNPQPTLNDLGHSNIVAMTGLSETNLDGNHPTLQNTDGSPRIIQNLSHAKRGIALSPVSTAGKTFILLASKNNSKEEELSPYSMAKKRRGVNQSTGAEIKKQTITEIKDQSDVVIEDQKDGRHRPQLSVVKIHSNDTAESIVEIKDPSGPVIKIKKSPKSPKAKTSLSPLRKQRTLNIAAKPSSMPQPVRKEVNLKTLLSDDEKMRYGERSLPEYQKIDLLGKGGFALVWLGVHKETGKRVAMKQMVRGQGGESTRNDILYGQYFFNRGGTPKEEFKNNPGIASVATYIDYRATKQDDWHISELCGKTIASLLFELKGEFSNSERIYKVKHLELLNIFKSDHNMLRLYIKKMAEVLDLLSSQNIVHCDIKPDNILISSDEATDEEPFKLKMIDFGSAFSWKDNGNIKMATPEFMPPEFLVALMSQNSRESSIDFLSNVCKPWSVDVWSFGAVLLEMVSGAPLWISLKCKIGNKNKAVRYGLFAAKGRAYDKICQKQKAFVDDIESMLGEFLDGWPKSDQFYDLLSNMLKWDPKKRISPSGILNHPFLKPE